MKIFFITIRILIIWISRIKNTWMYCSTRGSIVASRAKPEGCNTAPSAAIHPSIFNTWNSNYKYLYFIFLLIQKNERIFWFFFKYFLQIKRIFFQIPRIFLKFHVFFSNSTYFFSNSKYFFHCEIREFMYLCPRGVASKMQFWPIFHIFTQKNLNSNPEFSLQEKLGNWIYTARRIQYVYNLWNNSSFF